MVSLREYEWSKGHLNLIVRTTLWTVGVTYDQLTPPPPSTWCRSVEPILVKIQLLWLLDFRLGFVFVIFVIFLDYIWFKLSLVTRFAGMLVTPLAMCFAMLSCRSAQHLGRLVFFKYHYLSFVLPIYQFQYIARWKDKENKNYLSSDIDH